MKFFKCCALSILGIAIFLGIAGWFLDHHEKPDWYKNAFASGLNYCSSHMKNLTSPYKKELFAGHIKEGDHVLEIGAGGCVNFDYLPRNITFYGVEPNKFMHEYCRQNYQKFSSGAPVLLHSSFSEDMGSIKDNSIDAVISTHVLCSVSDQHKVLREIYRILKPEGKFIFFEHVGGPQNTTVRFVQDLITPAWRAFLDGCELNRETLNPIQATGFSRVHYEFKTFNESPALHFLPHLLGYAIK